MLTMTMPDLDGFIRALARYRLQVSPAILHTVQSTANEAVTWARATRLSGPPPGVLQVRTGRLRASFRAAVTQRGAVTEAQVGFLAPQAPFWAWVHEEGTTLVPRQAQALTIPLAGVTGRAGDYAHTFRRGRVIYQHLGGGAPRPLFILVRSVTIPPRPVLGPTVEHLTPLLLERLIALLSL